MPRPNHRLGPRPLLLHLMLAMRPSSAWPDVWRRWNAGSPDWTAHPADAAAPVPDAALLAGIAAYRRHPWQRGLADPPTIWAEGGTRLLDYGPDDAPPVFVVPSLVNRAHVLDLLEDHSMLRFLAGGGVRPLLLDWGFPDADERRFTLTDYIAGRLERAIGAVGKPTAVAGYCMGGLMALAAALRRPDRVTRLALLATPWDFWSPEPAAAQRLAACLPLLEPALALGAPCFVAIPARDRIVPRGSAQALADRLHGAVVHGPLAGHVGMVAGSRAQAALWAPLLGWLKG